MFECRNLSFCYGSSKVLHHISLSFARGELVGLLGPNGSGKSTLLKMLGASLPIDDGELVIFGQNGLDGRNYLKPSLRPLFGVLLQDFSSDDKISVKDNLLFAARLMGLDRKTAFEAVANTLELADLAKLAECPVKTLSMGMRRRLELYRTFMHKPKIVLLDEPTAGLDFSQSEKFLHFVQTYQRDTKALIIFSTHRDREYEYCDVVVMLNQGRILAQDSPKKFLADLNYMACTFQLANEANKDLLVKTGLPYFPHEKSANSDSLTFSAHLTPDRLTQLFDDYNLFKATFASFSISKPNLNDAFVSLAGQTSCAQ